MLCLRCLYDVLVEKYKVAPQDASEITDFLLPMLVYDPDKRTTAKQCLQHHWLKEYIADDLTLKNK